jgi:hypothetical protein
MGNDTKFKLGISGCPERQFAPGNPHRWQPGVSGNPVGLSLTRLQFEQAFHATLLAEGSPEEAAQLLWKAARQGEAWAIQNLCQRFAPQTPSLRLIQEVDDDRLDYSKLSDQQLEQLDAILEQAGVEPPALESREGPTPSV